MKTCVGGEARVVSALVPVLTVLVLVPAPALVLVLARGCGYGSYDAHSTHSQVQAIHDAGAVKQEEGDYTQRSNVGASGAHIPTSQYQVLR